METAIEAYLREKVLALTAGGVESYYASGDIQTELFDKDYLKGRDKAVLLVSGAEEIKAGQKNALLYDEVEDVFYSGRVTVKGWWEVSVRLYAPDLNTAMLLAREFRGLTAAERQFKDDSGLWWQVWQRGMIPYKRPSRLEPECYGVKLRFSGWVVSVLEDVPAMTDIAFEKVVTESSG